jgi:uncharacterized protein (DUF779 family)
MVVGGWLDVLGFLEGSWVFISKAKGKAWKELELKSNIIPLYHGGCGNTSAGTRIRSEE